jgi:transcription termination factor NusB
MDFLNKIYILVLEKENFLIYLIEKYAPKFNVEKMPLHSTLAIFIAIVEMFFLEEEIPAKVSINEAVEISKIF